MQSFNSKQKCDPYSWEDSSRATKTKAETYAFRGFSEMTLHGPAPEPTVGGWLLMWKLPLGGCI